MKFLAYFSIAAFGYVQAESEPMSISDLIQEFGDSNWDSFDAFSSDDCVKELVKEGFPKSDADRVKCFVAMPDFMCVTTPCEQPANTCDCVLEPPLPPFHELDNNERVYFKADLDEEDSWIPEQFCYETIDAARPDLMERILGLSCEILTIEAICEPDAITGDYGDCEPISHECSCIALYPTVAPEINSEAFDDLFSNREASFKSHNGDEESCHEIIDRARPDSIDVFDYKCEVITIMAMCLPDTVDCESERHTCNCKRPLIVLPEPVSPKDNKFSKKLAKKGKVRFPLKEGTVCEDYITIAQGTCKTKTSKKHEVTCFCKSNDRAAFMQG